jgi:2-oxoisovalerate dehydrogenase E1 component
VTRGLSAKYPDRVQNSPLAEASIAGVAGGMAIAGYKPIIEIQFADYAWPAFMQMRNEIPTLRWRSNGTWKNPMVVRIACGGRIKGVLSFMLPGDFLCTHQAGCGFPSNAEEPGFDQDCARCDDPVIFSTRLYRHITDLQNPIPITSFHLARAGQAGNSATIITWAPQFYGA